MSAQQSRAVRNLFRTFVRLTNDVERAAATKASSASSSSSSLPTDQAQSQPQPQPLPPPPSPTPIASLLARYARETNGKQFMTLNDLRNHIRETFRQENSDHQDLKLKLANGIQGIRTLENMLADLKRSTNPFQKQSTTPAATSSSSSPSTGSLTSVDDTWVETYIEKVRWLSNLDDEYSHGRSKRGKSGKDHTLVEIPLFPLTGTFFAPNKPLELFTPYSYWEFPTPGAEIMLKIFEPRYRQLYSDLLTQSSNRRFVVPFAHPHEPSVFAEYGLLYQITDYQEVADETNGVYQFVCQHVVTYPVKIRRVLNPEAYHKHDTYLRVEGEIEMDEVELDVPARRAIESALTEQMDGMVATKCRDALHTEGVWGFIRTWNTSLQQRLLQIELQIAAQVKLELTQKYGKDPPSGQVKEIVEQFQNQRRAELLRLKLDLSQSIPRILQTTTGDERLHVILDLIASLNSQTTP